MKQVNVDCLKRLFHLTGSYEDLIEFLLQEKIIDQDYLVNLSHEKDKVRELCHTLFLASKQEKLQLLQFDWVVLPVERIRLKLVTDMQTKEYTHNF